MKNLLTAFGVFLSLSLFGQYITNDPGTKPPKDGGPIVILTTNTGGHPNINQCFSRGDIIATVKFVLPLRLNTSIPFNTGSSNSLRMSEIKLTNVEHGEDHCIYYYYEYDLILNVNTPVICSPPPVYFNLYVGDQCLPDYLSGGGQLEFTCYNQDCWNDIKLQIPICKTCTGQEMPDDDVIVDAIENYSLSESVWPNPFHNELSFDSVIDINRAQLLDMSGRIIKDVPVNVSEVKTLDTKDIVTGLYILRMIYPDGSSDSFKVIKQ